MLVLIKEYKINKRHKNQAGFGLVEVLVLIVILVIIGTAGWLVYKHNHKNTNTSDVNTSTSNKAGTSTSTTGSTQKPAADLYTSADGVFTLTYPTGWLHADTPGQCGLITCVGQVDVAINRTSNTPDINILEVKTSATPTDWFAQNEGPTPQDVTNTNSINGYSTYYDQSGSSPQSLVDDSYVLSHDGYLVDISMRVIYVDANAGINNNFTQYVPQLTQMVNSIKFNN